MRRGLKRWTAIAMAAAMVTGLSIPAYAADNREKIPNVKIKITACDEPVAGESVGSVTVAPTSDSAKYKVDSAEFYDTRDSEWERGETPIVRVELSLKDNAVDDNRFYYTSKSKISVTGYHSEFKSAKILDGGNGLRVDIKLRAVSGDLDEVNDLYWTGRTAEWEEVEDADKYEVKLYRNGSTVTTVTTSSSHYDFYPYMSKAGDYTFKVRAVSNSDGEKSAWTDESDDYYMNASDVYTGAVPSNGGSSNVSGGTGWVQDQYGWWYGLSGGNRVRSNWLYVDNNWFHFDANGYMETGWIFADNNWFYLNPISDGTRGAMMTGVQAINGIYYYLNPVSDGTRGARLSGFQTINGSLYFFDPNSGAMWANAAVPNGRWAGPNGVVN